MNTLRCELLSSRSMNQLTNSLHKMMQTTNFQIMPTQTRQLAAIMFTDIVGHMAMELAIESEGNVKVN